MSKPQPQQPQATSTPPASKQVDWQRLRSAAGPYSLEAFNFVREGLTYTAHQIHRNPESVPEADRHINGQQLCLGLRDYAIEQYGLLAPIVLQHWNIRRTEDFGRIVFAMIAEGLMTKTAEDSIEDFRAVYDFDEAFTQDQVLARIGTG
jgi:uncharacterized repeat protein (TIGR04138 family)